MKKLTFILVAIVLFTACKSEKEKVLEQIEKNLNIYVNKSPFKPDFIDKVVINKIDTMTPKLIIKKRLSEYEYQYDRYIELAKLCMEIAKDEEDLYYMQNNYYLQEMHRNDYYKAKAEAKAYFDTVNMYKSLHETKFEEYEKCKDSISLKYYIINYSILGHQNNLEQFNMDSMIIGMTKDYLIVNYSDM